MAEWKRLLAQLCCDGKQEEEILSYASACGNDGADGLVFVDGSRIDEEHEYNIGLIRKMARAIDIPIFAGGRVKRLEDVKKYLYAGAKGVFLDASAEENVDMIKEAADRFGSEKIFMSTGADSPASCMTRRRQNGFRNTPSLGLLWLFLKKKCFRRQQK